MKRTKLVNKIAATAMSLFACATCLGVAAMSGVDGVADDAKVELAGGVWNDVGNYSIRWGSTNVDPNIPIYATQINKTNAANQTIKGVELSTDTPYTHTNGSYTVNGSAISHAQSITVEVDDAIEMDETVEFYFAPYVHSGLDKYQERRFVMALSDEDGIVEAANGSVSTYGFHSTGNFISWEFLQHYYWLPQKAAPEANGNGPHWYTTSSSGTTPGGYKQGLMDASKGEGITGVSNSQSGSRMGSWALARAFYGAEETGKGAMLVKATMKFTETDLVLYLQGVYESNLTDIKCDKGHSIDMEDSSAVCATCCFKQTYKLANLGIEYGSALKLYMGYYNVWARFAGNYGNLPMSLKLYNYKNGDVKSVTAKNETVSMKASEELNLVDNVNVAYFDGATAMADVTFTSDNDAVATIVDGKLVPVTNTLGGDVVVTATVGDKTATFTVTVDANTVTVGGNVVAGGNSYTLEDLYEGNYVLVGYKVNGKLYAVGDTIILTDDIVLEEVVVDFTMLYGASIRLDSTASIRFTAIIDTADFTALETLVGAENVSYGMTLTAGEDTYRINSKDANFKTGTHENDYTLYSAVMTGIPASDYTTELTANGYLKVTYADGDVVELAANLAEMEEDDVKASNVRSLTDVATAAYNDRNATQEGDYKYSDGNGQYSLYTMEQLAEIAKYMQN